MGNVNIQNEWGVSALMKACMHGSNEIVRLLVTNKANAELCSKRGDTALSLADKNGHVKTATILRQQCTQPNAPPASPMRGTLHPEKSKAYQAQNENLQNQM